MNFLKEEGFEPSKKIFLFDRKQLFAFAVCAVAAAALFFVLNTLELSARTAVIKIICMLNLGFLLFRLANYIFIQKNFDPSKMLPFHLCGFNVMLCAAAALTGNGVLIDIAFGLSPLPALCALIFPETDAAKYPSFKFRSIEYYFSHLTLIIAPLYMVRFLEHKPDIASFPSMTAVLAGMLIIAAAVNVAAKGNYMYVDHGPESTPLEFLNAKTGNFLYRVIIIALFMFSFVITHLAYILLF